MYERNLNIVFVPETLNFGREGVGFTGLVVFVLETDATMYHNVYFVRDYIYTLRHRYIY